MIQVTAADHRLLREPWGKLIANKGKEIWGSVTGRHMDGHGMINADPAVVAEGFAALKDETFDAYNYPQVWVESRQILQAVDQRIPENAARVVDLGCGPGTSTRLICHFAQPDWEIFGFDLTEHSIEQAQEKSESGGFVNKAGEVIRPHFECQSIAEQLMHGGEPLPDQSVDMALSAGVVGLYLNHDQAAALVKELHRVIKPGGFIALDAGPSNPVASLRRLAEAAGFVFQGLAKSCVIEPRPKLVFQR